MKILVVGDNGREVSRILNELAREDAYRVEWAKDLADVEGILEKFGECDVVILCPDNGLDQADEMATEVTMRSQNQPFIIAVWAPYAGRSVGTSNIALIMDAFDMNRFTRAVTSEPC